MPSEIVCFRRYWNGVSRTPRCPLNRAGGQAALMVPRAERRSWQRDMGVMMGGQVGQAQVRVQGYVGEVRWGMETRARRREAGLGMGIGMILKHV